MLFMQRIRRNDAGFSLAEVLVVVLIAGILAAIAIPLWVNQQKTQVDDMTRLDASTTSNALKELVIQNPTTPRLGYRTDTPHKKTATVWADLNGNGILDSNEPSRKINREIESRVVVRTLAPGKFEVYTWNPAGRHYTASNSAAKWSLAEGGFVDGKGSTTIAPM